MSSEEIQASGGQLDRVEHKLDDLISRISTMEERAHTQAGKIAANESHLQDLSTRMREVETAHAVSVALNKQGGQQLKNRWAALGSVAIVILGSIGAFVGNMVVKLFNIGGGA